MHHLAMAKGEPLHMPGGWALILPASVMVALLAAAYVHMHGLPSLTAIIYGVSPAVIALILHSWWRLFRLGMEDRFQYAIAAVSVVATLVLPGILTAVFLGAGLLGVGWYSLHARRHAASPRLHDVASFVLLAKMAWFLLVTGAFTFGGGLAVVPLLQKGLVEQGHWLTTPDFLTAIAVSMVTPGPVMTAATFAGYFVAGPFGAVICTIAISCLRSCWFCSLLLHSCAIAPNRSCRASSRASMQRPSVPSWLPRSCSAGAQSETR